MNAKYIGRFLLRSLTTATAVFGISQLSQAAEAGSPYSAAQMVVTVQSRGDSLGRDLQTDDLAVYQGRSLRRVTSLERLSGEQAPTQLLVYVDGSAGVETLRTLLPDLKDFVRTLPATTEVGVGSLRAGESPIRQAFTTNPQKAIDALDALVTAPGDSGSSYATLLYLAKHWPSQSPTMGRRAVLMLTDGKDGNHGISASDPYVEAAMRNSQIAGIAVYSIYISNAGSYTPSDWATSPGQSNLLALSNATGGHFYCEGLSAPVSLTPYLRDLRERLSNQYRITFESKSDAGAQAVTVQTGMPGVSIIAPTRVYVLPARGEQVAKNVSPSQLAQNGQ
jgi:hypothetical protein